MGPGGSLPLQLLDRAAELAAIATAIESACSGSGSALLVEGAAGIGKTRLLTNACERAARAGMTVLAARAAEFEDGYAWGVVRQLFEAEMRTGGGQRLADDAMALAALALTRDAQRGDEDSFAVLHGLYWLTADIAQQAPLLLAVDDLHWADRPSQRFVAHLAHRLEGLAVLLVLTVREPRSGTAEQKSLIAGLAAEASVIALRPAALGAAACAELVRGTLGAGPSPSFQEACRELTGGNPLLLRGLLASLAAEGLKGTDAEVPHLRRLTPGSVSRSVLLQLGRMPAAALAAARAVAVLGTAATAERAGWLAGLDDDTCAEAIGALMAERFIEGERALRFVHPLVRSAVYQDLAPPVRQRWHKRAARMLDEEDAAAAEVTVHLLAAAATGDAWVVDRLRQAAADARNRGAPDVAIQCLERALAEPPSAGARGDVLFELGSAQTFHAPAAAAEHLAEALARSADWPRRGEITLALSQALGLCGRFADAAEVLQTAIGASGDDSLPDRRFAAGRAPQRRALGPRCPAGHAAGPRAAAGAGRRRRGTRSPAARQPGDRARRGRPGPRAGDPSCPRGRPGDASADVAHLDRAARGGHRAAVRRPERRGPARGRIRGCGWRSSGDGHWRPRSPPRWRR